MRCHQLRAGLGITDGANSATNASEAANHQAMIFARCRVNGVGVVVLACWPCKLNVVAQWRWKGTMQKYRTNAACQDCREGGRSTVCSDARR